MNPVLLHVQFSCSSPHFTRERRNSHLTKEETTAQKEGPHKNVELGATWIHTGTQLMNGRENKRIFFLACFCPVMNVITSTHLLFIVLALSRNVKEKIVIVDLCPAPTVCAGNVMSETKALDSWRNGERGI